MMGDPGVPSGRPDDSGRNSHPSHGGHPSGLQPASAARERRRGRWRLLVPVLTGVATLTFLLGFGLTRDPTVLRSTLVGARAPSFDLPSLDGSGAGVRLADLRGNVVVVNFWASWCVDCRIEHPALVAAWDRFRDQGVVFLGIPFQDSTEGSRTYLREVGDEWPQLADPGSRTALAFGVYGVPETFILGPDGRVAYRHLGAISYEVLVARIGELLERRTA